MTLTLILQIITLLLALGAAVGSLYNAFWIQRPWFKDHNAQKAVYRAPMPSEDYPTQSVGSLPADFIKGNK